MVKRAVLLINLGSPDAPTTPAVRRYLREFLLDPRVIDIPALARALLVYLLILPFRSSRSAEAYRKIWQVGGSPLVIAGRELQVKLQKQLGDSYEVSLGMRYGEPSLARVVRKLGQRSWEEIIVVPLFPQYASASTGSAMEVVLQEMAKENMIPAMRVLPDYYADPGFIASFVSVAQRELATYPADFVLFSYHGLPERQIRRTDRAGTHCLASENCCDRITEANRFCYRAQCFATTRALVAGLKLSPDRYSTSFQSRLGRTPWIKPYTDEVLATLRQRGVKRLAIMCPAFVADCLETLEEIGMRAAEDWHKLGGEDLRLIPSLNSDDTWCETIARWVREPLAINAAQ